MPTTFEQTIKIAIDSYQARATKWGGDISSRRVDDIQAHQTRLCFLSVFKPRQLA